jgi:acyl-CoA reductase-like NAD-dependent aldehyde dehydrogenase
MATGKMRPLKNVDPYKDEVILEIPQADRNDLDDAYAAAARAGRLGLRPAKRARGYFCAA